MATLSQAWNIATGALASDQAAISVVSQNIASANTLGYTTETVKWGAVDTVTVGSQSEPAGVVFQGASSQRDRVLNQRIDQQSQDQSNTAARLTALDNLQSIFSGATKASGSTGGVADIGQQLTSFFQSFTQLSADPSNPSLRSAVLSAAQGVAITFNQASSSLEQQRAGLDQTITSAASQVNALTKDIAHLNGQIASTSPNGDAGTLEDQRQSDLEQLSQLVGLHVITNENNGLTLTTSTGAVLVQGSQSNQLQTTLSGGVVHLSLAGADQTAALTNAGGQIGGTLQARDVDLPGAIAAVDQMAWSVGSAVNAQQAAGVDATGASGASLFNLGSSAPGSAANISVSLTDPNGIAASASGAGSLDGSNASAVAAIGSKAIVSGATPTAAYSTLVGSIGTEVSASTTTQASQNASLQQLKSQQSALSSVNLNDQAALLQTYEQAYQASSKVFTILNTLIASAINLGTETPVA
jgi:flagellar hook-associated protein 1 FlgK